MYQGLPVVTVFLAKHKGLGTLFNPDIFKGLKEQHQATYILLPAKTKEMV